MRRLAAALAALILAGGAKAATWDHGCDGSGSTFGIADSTTIDGNERACWSFANADGTTTSPAFTVVVDRALICFDPDLGSVGVPAGAGVITPHYCLKGSKPSSNPENECIGLGALTGTEGDASTQDACVSVGQGVYYIAVDTACGAAHSCLVSIQGQPRAGR